MPTAPDFWKTHNPMACALVPLSWVYYAFYSLHQKKRAKNPLKVSVPVISIGNITVGGTGKTPLVEALARHYAGQGYLVGILSRGYGGKARYPYKVTEADSADAVGDEPRMLLESLRDIAAQIWVGADRKKSAQRAIAAGCGLLILDDGFQYRSLARDVDIIVLGSIGNGHLLPAGPLRSPLSELERATAIVTYNGDSKNDKYIHLTLEANKQDVVALNGKKLLAFCGLGNPDKFFHALRQAGANIATTDSFPDHHTYTEQDLKELQKKATALGASLVTTHKDAVKLPASFSVAVARATLGGDTKKLFEKISFN